MKRIMSLALALVVFIVFVNPLEVYAFTGNNDNQIDNEQIEIKESIFIEGNYYIFTTTYNNEGNRTGYVII